FMSPEQAQGLTRIDGRSDVYGVGAVAYYLMTGKLPFDRESTLQMLHAHAYEPFVPEFGNAVPDDLRDVIVRCLQKDPGRRYQDAADLERALVACECGDPWTAERAEEWWRQRGDLVAATGGTREGSQVTPL